MPPLSRRTFISASAAVGLLGAETAVLAKSGENVFPVGSISPEGIFGVYQTEARAMIIIRSAGRVPIPVVFDTGTNGNAVDVAVAKILQLKQVPNHINKVVDGATGKSFDAYEYVMPDISIGSLKIGDRQIAAYAYDTPDEAGIFGPNLFTGQLVYVDLGASRVRVINKTSSALSERKAIPYIGTPGNGLPAVEILLPGKDGTTPGDIVMAKLDTGNNLPLRLPITYIDQVPLMRPAAIVGRSTSVSGSRDVMGGQIKGEVRIGSYSLVDPDVVFDGLTPNVGLPVARQLRILLDPEAEQGWLVTPVTLTPAKLAEYAGQYGIRKISVDKDRLVYQRQSGPARNLRPLGGDLFDLGGSQDQIQFERAEGQVVRLVLISSTNQMLPFEKTGSE